MTNLEKIVEPLIIGLGILAIGLIVYEDRKYWQKPPYDPKKYKEYVEKLRKFGL